MSKISERCGIIEVHRADVEKDKNLCRGKFKVNY